MSSPNTAGTRGPIYTDGPFVLRFFRDDGGTLRCRVVESQRGTAWVVPDCAELRRLLSIPKEQR